MFEEALEVAVKNVLSFIKGEGVRNLVNREDYL
jgi:hypothetical protein